MPELLFRGWYRPQTCEGTMNALFPTQPHKVLCTRREAAEMLGRSVDTVKRFERAGKLKPVRLGSARNAVVSIRISEVVKLIEEATASD